MIDPNPVPSEDRRQAIFAALVEAQDRARSVHEAKQEVLARFGILGHGRANRTGGDGQRLATARRRRINTAPLASTCPPTRSCGIRR